MKDPVRSKRRETRINRIAMAGIGLYSLAAFVQILDAFVLSSFPWLDIWFVSLRNLLVVGGVVVSLWANAYLRYRLFKCDIKMRKVVSRMGIDQQELDNYIKFRNHIAVQEMAARMKKKAP